MNPVEDKQDEAVAPNVKKSTLMEKAKKTAVAVSGGTLVAVGIPLIPLPGPGCLVVAGGLSVLATEFPGAQKVLNKGTDALRKFGNGDSHEDELGLGFEIVEDPMAQTAQTAQTPLKSGVDSLRSVTREKIIPLIDRHFDASPNTSNSASATPSTTVNENIKSSTTADTFKTLYW